jgi:hypothetical protein
MDYTADLPCLRSALRGISYINEKQFGSGIPFGIGIDAHPFATIDMAANIPINTIILTTS